MRYFKSITGTSPKHWNIPVRYLTAGIMIRYFSLPPFLIQILSTELSFEENNQLLLSFILLFLLSSKSPYEIVNTAVRVWTSKHV